MLALLSTANIKDLKLSDGSTQLEYVSVNIHVFPLQSAETDIASFRICRPSHVSGPLVVFTSALRKSELDLWRFQSWDS